MESLQPETREHDPSMTPSGRPVKVQRSSPLTLNPIQHVLGEVGHHLKKWKRAALKQSLSQRVYTLQQIKLEADLSKTPEAKMKRQQSRESLSNMGVALFHPLNYDDWEQTIESEEEEHRISPPLEDELPIIENMVQVMATSDDIPLLLSITTMTLLVPSLPFTLHSRTWVRLYSSHKHGDSFPAFMHRVRGHSRTLLVLETSAGQVFGGFADAPWEQGVLSKDGCFFGTGQSFLYSVNEDGTVDTHRWTALNEYSQFCKTGSVGMGGGGRNGTFGLFLHDQFTRGSSGPCETFGTSSSLGDQEHFDIVEFQVFGFTHAH